MAGQAAGDDDEPNVIDLARARSRRAEPVPWPADGPSADLVAAAALESTPRDAALVAADGTVLAVNRRWALATPACLPGTDVFGAWRLGELEPTDGAHVMTGLRAALRGSDPFEHRCHLREPQDRTTFVVLAMPLGGPAGGAVVTVDVRDGDDPLTGLANRGRFIDELTAALARAAGTAGHVGVLVVNLHDFKLVNQAYGHAIGDQLLVEVGRRLVEVAAESDHVGHLGGDEFAVLRPSARGADDLAGLAGALATRLAMPFRAGTRQVHLGSDVGCRIADPSVPETAVEVLRDAVAAVRDAREGGAVNFFSDSTRARVLRRLALEQELHRALEDEALDVAFQPQVDVRTGEVHGAEALVRWHHPELGDVSPSEFVPIAESNGLIRPLGELVLRKACAELARWKALGAAPAFVTVNLSPLQLADDALVLLVRHLLTEHRLRPHELCLELTEGALMASPDRAIDVLRTLRDMGISLALDDFGTGHSSLGMLKQLPVDVLKVDRAFVAGLAVDEQDRAIVTAILALASALGLRTVAEGVEEHDQAERLLRLGCGVVQGWLYAPAVPGAEFPALCHDGFTPLAAAPG